MLNRIVIWLISLFLLISCSNSEYNIGEKINYKNFNVSDEYVLYNAAQLLPLWKDKRNENIKIAIDNDLISYIQNSSEDEIKKYSTQLSEINIDKIYVEPGVCYFIELGNNKYGYLGRIDTTLDFENLSIDFIFEKHFSVLIGNITRPLSYSEYIEWIGNSVFIDDFSDKKKYVFN